MNDNLKELENIDAFVETHLEKIVKMITIA